MPYRKNLIQTVYMTINSMKKVIYYIIHTGYEYLFFGHSINYACAEHHI